MRRSRTLALLALAALILVGAWVLLAHPPQRADAPIAIVPAHGVASHESPSPAITLAALDVAPLMAAPEATMRKPVDATVETFTLQRPLDVKRVGNKEVLATDRCANVNRLITSVRFDRVDMVLVQLELDEESILAILDRTGRFEDKRHGPYSMTARIGQKESSVTSRVGTRTYSFTSAEFPEYPEVASAALARNRNERVEDSAYKMTQRVLARAEEALRGCREQNGQKKR